MGKLRTFSRRAFLVGATAIAGGVAFGTYMVKKDHDNPLDRDLNSGEAALNPWVKIDGEKITLITPHADTGQGVVAMQALLIAEEMDLEMGQFEIDHGAAAPAYYNTAMGAEVAPFLEEDDSFAANAARSTFESVFKVLGLQVTGGSSSAPDSYEKLRIAGAVARETLKKAASKKTGIAIKDLSTKEGAVHLPDGTSIAYTELAEMAADISPVESVSLRSPSQWRLIGKPLKRLDIVAKSTGTLSYGIDMEMEGMVYASAITNPRQGGVMNAYDAAEAEKMRGVDKIIAIKNGAAVIADNTWRAIQAANAIKFDWGDAPYPAEMEGHWQEVANSFVEERKDSEWLNIGDVEKAQSEGETFESEYKTPYVAHAPLEPLNATVLVKDDRVDIWTSHQVPQYVESKVAGVTGHEIEQVYFHNLYGGGSFGHRLEFEHITQAAEVANAMKGTPVKFTLSREEDFAHDFPRQIAMSRAKGTVKDGKVESFDLAIASVSASASQAGRIGVSLAGADKQIVSGAWNLAYDIPNFRVTAYRVPELAPTSSWRSVGASSAGFFADSSLDELIHKAGADPLEERLRLMANPVAQKVLEAVGEMSNWGSPLGENRARGIAYVHSFGVPVAEVVEISQTDDGIKIDKVFVAADVGKVIDPINFDNQVKGGIVWGLGHAMNCEITYSDGMAEQSNFDEFEGMRMHQCPKIMVRGLENGSRVRGIGEPPIPPAAPALANAIFALTGKRLREMPFNKYVDFA